MYSVEDLLISHGYKLPKNAPSANKNQYADCHHEITENRSGHATVNGYETDSGAYVYSRQAPAKGYFSENECRESSQRRKAGSGNQGDTQPSGDFHTTDAGFNDGSSGMYSSRQRSERDVAHWRRRGQDFSVLLNYADSGEPRGNNSSKPEEVRQEVFAKDPKSERENAHLKEQDVVQGKRTITGNRKWQSLGTEEWKPAVGLGRQLSDGDGDRWAQEQHCHRPEGGTVHPKTKGKSQSLPRVLSPGSLQFVDMSAATQETCSSQRLNSKYLDRPANKEQWTENSRPGAPVALLPKPRFSRPLKPPSYEAHQQTRGSSEMIAGGPDLKAKDGAGSNFSKSEEARVEPFSQETAGSNMEPPVYVPPPSYKTPFQKKGNQKTFHEVPNQKYRSEVQQVPESRDTGKWLSRQVDSSWVEHQKDKSILSKKHMYPGFIDDHLGCIQYIPFDDPRLKHMLGGPCGNPLTDSDKIKNSKKEMPTDKVFEQSTQDSAFLIPPGLIYDVASKASNTEHANSNRWFSASQKQNDNLVASNQNCALYHKDQSNPYQARMSRQYPQPGQGFAETVTQVKKFEPGAGTERKRNSKRTLNETIFCLVSVPVHLQPNGQSSDQNNNTMTLGTVENAAGKNTGSLENQTLHSTSSTDLELQALTGRMMNHKAGRKPQQRTDTDYKEMDGLKSSQLQKHKELRYSGSWPGDQYRDQETQTSYIEPLQGASQGAPSNQAHNQCHSDSETKELNLDTEGGRYVQHGYPMKGQMCLNPSSNSAFSRTTNFSNQVNKSKAHQMQPSGNLGEKNISAMRCETKPSSASNGKAAFGQFLLKPVSRRPWDAIEELESINKEFQDQIGTRAAGNQFIGDPEMAYKEPGNLQTGSCDTEIVKTEVWNQKHVQSILSEPLPYTTSRMNCVSQCSTVPPDPEYNNMRDVSRTSLKTAGVSRLAQKNNPVLQEHKYGDIRAVSQTSLKSVVTSRTSKQDTPFPSEPLYGDVEAVSQTALKTVSGLSKQDKIEPGRKIKDFSIPKVNGQEISSNSFGIAIEDSSFQEIRSINCNINTQQEERKRVNGLTGVTFLPDKDTTNESDDDVSCNWITYKTDKTQSAALSELFEFKSAEDIPENESLEVRAARILGIDVPVESLSVADQLLELDKLEPLTERHAFTKGVTERTNGKSGHVRGELEDSCAGDAAESVEHVRRKEERELTKARKEINIVCLQKCHVENKVKRDPGKGENVSGKFLVPGAIEEKMIAATPDSDKKSRSTSRMIEALQGKLASSPSRSVLERMVRMKEVDSVSRMRRLSIKSSDSDEAEHEKTPKQRQQETGSIFTFTTHRESLNNHSSQGAAVTKRIITLTQRKERLREDEGGIYLSDSYDPSRVERV
ncbi:junctional protein associated with coronary artery disease-like [Polyodon spathula]|uniref:junctional protein associated with coronary artery disease-like n=1 Tax=Polyodon spathula TaxID=7913 RepID=UPI001B7DB31A|nr:junctional protein associated with coronary artery disease-like [Polyodon spathula]